MNDLLSELAKYEDYRDSSVKWIGEIPCHWSLNRVKQITTKIGSGITPSGGGTSYLDTGIPLLRSQNIHFGKIDLSEVAFISIETHNLMSNSKVQKGDILLNITGASIGRCHYVDMDLELNVNQHVCIVRPKKEIFYIFLNFLLASEVGQGQIWFFQQGGGREGLNFQAIKNFLIPLPPLEEQTAIATFLDRKTAQIDRAVAIKEKQIALLRERKQILIQNAVTRGLDPDVPMRDSGVEWIGEIPGHWKTPRTKYLFKEVNERTKTGSEMLFSLRMDVGLVPHDEVSDKIIHPENLIDYKIVQPGQLVMNRMRASIGVFGVANKKGLVSPDYAVFEIDMKANSEFYLRLFKTPNMGAEFRLHSKGLGTGSSGFLRIYSEDFGNIKVPHPPLKEQTAIVAHIETQSQKIDHAVALQQQQIEKLKEYKATLINSAVTGKFRVPMVSTSTFQPLHPNENQNSFPASETVRTNSMGYGAKD